MQVGLDVTYMYTNLVGMASPVSEIPVLSKTAKLVIKKFDRSESTQKIHASRD